MISREKCLEMIVQCCTTKHGIKVFPTEQMLEALINRAYAEGQKDMREQIEKKDKPAGVTLSGFFANARNY